MKYIEIVTSHRISRQSSQYRLYCKYIEMQFVSECNPAFLDHSLPFSHTIRIYNYAVRIRMRPARIIARNRKQSVHYIFYRTRSRENICRKSDYYLITVLDVSYYDIQLILNGPAGRAGMQRGDIILKLDGEETNSVRDLRAKIAEHKVGETVKVEFDRNGKKQTVDVTLDEMPQQDTK